MTDTYWCYEHNAYHDSGYHERERQRRLGRLEHVELRKPAEVKDPDDVVYVFDGYGTLSADQVERTRQWIEDIPSNWQVYVSYWHCVPWAQRVSVRDRSRIVTRQRQRRNW